ncbi:MAG: glycosyltransferase [Solirubrobacterales bacterium]
MNAASPPETHSDGSREPTLAAIVPASDGPPTLERCLAALAAGERRPDELIAQREPGGAGPAAARNAGAARSEASVLVFVDSDVEVHADALARIEARFAADPGLAAVFGAYDDEPAAPGLASRFRNLLHHHVHVTSPGEADTFWAGLGAVRRDEFEALGGFDAERFRQPSVEDIELGMRLRERGARIVLDPAIRGRHLKSWTAWTMVRTDFARRGVPWARLLLAGGRGRGALNLGWRHRASAGAAVLLVFATLARRPRTALAAASGVAAINRGFYLLLLRRGGLPLLGAGIALHLVHQLVAVAALPAALAVHAYDRLGSTWRLSRNMSDFRATGGPR